MSAVNTVPPINGHSHSSRNSNASDTHNSSASTASPEIEATISRLSAYRNVRGVMIISRGSVLGDSEDGVGSGIIRCNGAVFEGEGGSKYANALERVVAGVTKAVDECDQGVSDALSGVALIRATQTILDHLCFLSSPQDELKFMRIRTKRHELIITPGT